jgi:EmrB/QacA subfamily drug resistance transporter
MALTMDGRGEGPSDGRGAARPSRRWWTLAVVATAQLMVVLDGTIVNIALPAAQRDLGFSDANRQWIVTAYSLAFGCLLLVGGRILDRVGRKNGFIVGLVGFAIASALGGWAPDFTVLVVARAVQGAFGALLAPGALSILTITFRDSPDRGRAFGIYGAVASGGGAIGLIVGGVLTESLSWRWCLYVNVAFALVAVVGAVMLLPGRDSSAPSEGIDWPGTLLVVGGLFAIVYGFATSETDGWADAHTLVSLGAGIVLLTAFAIAETRAAHPLLPLSIVLHRVRGTAYLVMLLSAVGMYALYLFLAYYLQDVLGYSPLAAGLAFLPMTVAVAVSSTMVNTPFLARLGLRVVVPVSAVVAAAGLAYLTGIQAHSSYAGVVLPGLIGAGVGLGAIFASTIGSATIGVDLRQAGVASASVNTAQQVGGAVGVATLSSISASAASGYLTSHHGAQVGAALASYHAAFWAAAASLLVAAVVALLLFPRPSWRSASGESRAPSRDTVREPSAAV